MEKVNTNNLKQLINQNYCTGICVRGILIEPGFCPPPFISFTAAITEIKAAVAIKCSWKKREDEYLTASIMVVVVVVLPFQLVVLVFVRCHMMV